MSDDAPGLPPKTPPTPPPPGYGPPQPGWAPPKHPQAVTVLVLGILGVTLCGLTAPFAWVMGNRALAEIDAQPGRYGGRSEANAGRVLGIVGSALLVLSLLAVAAMFFLFLFGVAIIGESYDDATVDTVLGLLGR
jgi:uncharacterized membrane protein YjgN (DUF898 family)